MRVCWEGLQDMVIGIKTGQLQLYQSAPVYSGEMLEGVILLPCTSEGSVLVLLWVRCCSIVHFTLALCSAAAGSGSNKPW